MNIFDILSSNEDFSLHEIVVQIHFVKLAVYLLLFDHVQFVTFYAVELAALHLLRYLLEIVYCLIFVKSEHSFCLDIFIL